jgi:hypothetical protein
MLLTANEGLPGIDEANAALPQVAHASEVKW